MPVTYFATYEWCNGIVGVDIMISWNWCQFQDWLEGLYTHGINALVGTQVLFVVFSEFSLTSLSKLGKEKIMVCHWQMAVGRPKAF